MKKQLAVFTVVLLGAMAIAEETSTPISFRLGIDYPTNSVTRGAAKEFYGFGLQRKVSSINSSEHYSTDLEISIDYYGRGDYRHIPILANYVGYSKKGDSFWSIGGGFGFIKRPIIGGTESVGRLAYQASIGMNLSSGPTASFVEVKYFGSELSELNSFGLYYGIRF
ncbi:MAG: hypothetical protein WCG75_06930 [Armatimonadota bacterium]